MSTKVRSKKREPIPWEQIDWVSVLPTNEQRALSRTLAVVDVGPGRRLLREGTVGHDCYVILTGVAEVRHGEQRIATLGPGDFVGEIGSLAHTPRVADVWSVTELSVGVATEPELMAMLEDCPMLSRRLMRHLSRLAAEGLTGGGGPES
jgi:CRP-like cAMP-binding protein